MTTVSRVTFYGLLVLNLILAVAVINLGAFAKKGARYTSADGDLERAERIEGDRLCMERIGAVEKVIAGMAASGGDSHVR